MVFKHQCDALQIAIERRNLLGRPQWRHEHVVRAFWERVFKLWEEAEVTLESWLTFLKV